MTAALQVDTLTADQLSWQFRDGPPMFHYGQHRHVADIDPFPGYAHELDVVIETVSQVTALWTPEWDVDLLVADREEIARSNGHSSLHETGHYEGDDWIKDDPRGLIFLSGKRVPPHPAMTRYLVAHEYGHNVEWMLNAAAGAKYASDETLMRSYAEMRGLPDNHHGNGGTWHDAATEVFACDFRVLILHVELEFWPHRGVDRPGSAVAAWWEQQRIAHDQRLAAKQEATP